MADVRPLAIVATYNDVDIAPQVVRKLLQGGIDVHVIDNWSSDGTYEVLADLRSHTIERFPASGASRYFQLRPILRRKEEIAAAFPGRWIISQDSDEIRCSPWPGIGLRQGIERVSDAGFNAIDFDVLNFRPVDDRFRLGDDPETHFQFFERFVQPMPQVQAWLQPERRVMISASGGHEVVFDGRRIFPEYFVVKHYSFRHPAQARRKVLERLQRFDPEERANGWHVHYDRFADAGELIWDPSRLSRFSLT
jgi:hypothetical protein